MCTVCSMVAPPPLSPLPAHKTHATGKPSSLGTHSPLQASPLTASATGSPTVVANYRYNTSAMYLPAGSSFSYPDNAKLDPGACSPPYSLSVFTWQAALLHCACFAIGPCQPAPCLRCCDPPPPHHPQPPTHQ
jgi:hypothetical protein